MTTSPFGFGALSRSLGRAARLALLGLLALAIASCGGSNNSDSGSTQIRVFNAIVEGGAVTVTVGTATVANGVGFEGLTTYSPASSGSQQFKVTLSGGTSPSIDTTLLLVGGTNYTYVLYGTASAPSAMLVQDVAGTVTTGQFNLRVANAAFGNTALDVYVTTPGASLDSASPNINNAGFGATTAFAALTSGSFQVRFTLHNSKQLIYDAGTLTFASGTSYTLVAYTKASGALVNAALLPIDATGSGALANSKIAQLKLVHAAPGTAAINAFVNGTVVYANVPYQGITSYGASSPGRRR